MKGFYKLSILLIVLIFITGLVYAESDAGLNCADQESFTTVMDTPLQTLSPILEGCKSCGDKKKKKKHKHNYHLQFRP